MEMSFIFGILLNHFLKFNPSRILFCSNSNTICFQKFQTRAMHIRIAQWRIELTTSFFWQFFVPKLYSWFLKIGKMILNNNLLFIWSIWVSGNRWIIENIIWMQISSVSEAGRAKVNDCIISKLINTDNKISTLLLLEDFVLIFLLWLLCYQS